MKIFRLPPGSRGVTWGDNLQYIILIENILVCTQNDPNDPIRNFLFATSKENIRKKTLHFVAFENLELEFVCFYLI